MSDTTEDKNLRIQPTVEKDIDPLTELEEEIQEGFRSQQDYPSANKDKAKEEVNDREPAGKEIRSKDNPSDNEKETGPKYSKPSSSKEETAQSKEDYDALSKKLDLVNERLYENQRFARSMNQSRSQVIQQIQKDIEEGDISEEIGERLMTLLKASSLKEPEGLMKGDAAPHASSPFQKFFDIATPDIVQTYLEVTEDEGYEDKAKAFGAFLKEASSEELDSLYKELEQLSSRPTALLKRMLHEGDQYLQSGFGEFMKAGGFRQYSVLKREEINTLLKKIDTLQNKIIKYESYDKPTYHLEELRGQQGDEEGDTSDPLLPIFRYPGVGKAYQRS